MSNRGEAARTEVEQEIEKMRPKPTPSGHRVNLDDLAGLRWGVGGRAVETVGLTVTAPSQGMSGGGRVGGERPALAPLPHDPVIDFSHVPLFDTLFPPVDGHEEVSDLMAFFYGIDPHVFPGLQEKMLILRILHPLFQADEPKAFDAIWFSLIQIFQSAPEVKHCFERWLVSVQWSVPSDDVDGLSRQRKIQWKIFFQENFPLDFPLSKNGDALFAACTLDNKDIRAFPIRDIFRFLRK